MNIKAIKVITILFTMTRHVEMAKTNTAPCIALPYESYFLKNVRSFIQPITGLSEIIYASKRNAIYFKFADVSRGGRNMKIGSLIYNKDSLAKYLKIDYVNTFAYDELNDKIFVGTNAGLFFVNHQNDVYSTSVTETVLSVSVKKGTIYYVNHSNEVKVFKSNGSIYKLALLDIAQIKRLVVNNQFDMIALTEKFEVMTLSHENGMKFFNSKSLGQAQPINLSVDNDDNLYVYTTNGVFKMNKSGGLDSVWNSGTLQGLAFVNNGEIISGSSGVVTVWQRYNKKPC